HEDIGAALHLVVDFGIAFEIIASGTGSANDFALQAFRLQHLDGVRHLLHSGIDLRLALCEVAYVLRRALIGLQTREHQSRRRRNLPREFDHGCAWLDAATARTTVYFH